MISAILPLLRCPVCKAAPVLETDNGVRCPPCGAVFPVHDGYLDLLPSAGREVITPFQRIMQAPPVVSVYERWWRRAGYRLAASRSFDDELRTVLNLHRGTDSAASLDVACGPGVFTRPLARATQGLVVGFDLSRPMLRHAVRKAQAECITNIQFIRGTVFRMPFLSAGFSRVSCCGALHLFDDPGAALLEIARVMSPGGHLTAQTTIRPQRSPGTVWFLERWIRFGFFDEEELRGLLAHHGFDVLESERHRISFTFRARLRA